MKVFREIAYHYDYDGDLDDPSNTFIEEDAVDVDDYQIATMAQAILEEPLVVGDLKTTRAGFLTTREAIAIAAAYYGRVSPVKPMFYINPLTR